MKYLLLILAISITACFAPKNAEPVTMSKLGLNGTQLVNQNNEPVVLRGISFGWHNLWPRFYNEGSVKELVTKWNANVIRASMGIELNKRGYLGSPEESKKLIKQVVDAAIANNVYVIIDWHDHNIHTKESVEFFSEMSSIYGRRPNVIYEIYNEPDRETWPEVKAYSIEVIKAIRKNDPDNIILVGSPQWSQALHLPAQDPIKGFDNLMYTMHFYAGTHKQWLRDTTDAAMRAGLPVFISECAGMEATGNGPIDYAEWKRYVDWMKDRKLSWVAWSLSDKDETCSMLLPAAASDGNWDDAVIKEWGKMVRKELEE